MDLKERIAGLKDAVAKNQVQSHQQVLNGLFSSCKEYSAVMFDFDIMKRMLVDCIMDDEDMENADRVAEQEEYARETLLENLIKANQVCAELGLAPLTDSDSDCRRDLDIEEVLLYRLIVMDGL